MNSTRRQDSARPAKRFGRLTRPGCLRGPRRLLLVPLLAAAGIVLAPPLPGHESLYQYLEVRQLECGDYGISIPIHLAELADDLGIDPNRGDLEWWADLSPAERETLAGRARAFLETCFRFTDPSVSVKLANSLSADGISARAENSIRPGCAVASITIPREMKELSCLYRLAHKRLMLVIIRPGRFPRVLDHPSPSEIAIRLSPSSS